MRRALVSVHTLCILFVGLDPSADASCGCIHLAIALVSIYTKATVQQDSSLVSGLGSRRCGQFQQPLYNNNLECGRETVGRSPSTGIFTIVFVVFDFAVKRALFDVSRFPWRLLFEFREIYARRICECVERRRRLRLVARQQLQHKVRAVRGGHVTVYRPDYTSHQLCCVLATFQRR